VFDVETVYDDESCDATSVSSFMPEVHWMNTILDICTVSGEKSFSPFLDALNIDCTSAETFVSTIDPSFVSSLPELLNTRYICEPFVSEFDLDEDDQPKDLVPSTVLMARSINNHASEDALLALMDSGSNAVFINRSKLPAGCTPSLLPRRMTSTTAAGTFTVTARVNLEDVVLPEFSRSLRIDKLTALVFDAPDCKYDVIVGRNFMLPNNFDIKFST
jgi:hypothetical protein